MKNFIILLLSIIFIIFSLYNVNASLSLSSEKIVFNLESGKQECQSLMIFSQDYFGALKIRDVWSENINESNINKYNLTISELGGSIYYNPFIENFSGNKEVEICISINEIRNISRGAIIFTPTSNSNVVVEVGTWVFVNVTKTETPENPINTGSSGGERSSSRHLSSISSNFEIDNSNIDNISKTTNLPEVIKLGGAGITGAVIGKENNDNRKIIIVLGFSSFILFSIILALLIRINKSRK